MTKTIIWGTIADRAGIIEQHEDTVQELPAGGVRVQRRAVLAHEPASSYATTHPAMPLRYAHGDEIGRIVALRRAHGNMYAVGLCDLEPDELTLLAGANGLKFSTGTDTVIGQPLRIVEISLVDEAATVGLPPVRWHKEGVSKGSVPLWVGAELERAETRTERRSRSAGELRVHDVDETVDNAPPIEIRHAVLTEVRFPQRIIEVVAVPYDEPAIVEYDRELWYESFERGSFAGIEEYASRVPVNRDHDLSEVVGKAVSFQPDREEGLVGEIRIASTARGEDTLTLASENMLSVSIGFASPLRDQVFDRPTRRRRIKKAFLDHLAFVAAAAYQGAGVLAVRTRQNAGDVSPVETPNLDEVLRWQESR
jgi:HK97 family phage prohead protease